MLTLLYDEPIRRKMHRKRTQRSNCDALATASGRHVVQHRLLLLFLWFNISAPVVGAKFYGDCYNCDQGFPYSGSNQVRPAFSLHQPQRRLDRKTNHDRSGFHSESSFFPNQNQPIVCNSYGRKRSVLLPFLLSASIDGENDNGIVEPNRFDPLESATTVQSVEFMQTIILQQQRQIDALLQLLQQQRSPSMNGPFAVAGNAFVPEQSTLLFQSLPSQFGQDATNHLAKSMSADQHLHGNQKALKAMLFIDGTWLYYSIHERLAKDCSIIQKYGRGWQHRYDIDWAKLPSLLCQTMQRELMEQIKEATGKDTSEDIQVHLVRSSVYTSYKADTPTTSYRYKLFQELQKANYHVHMMETVGKSEKCVDIQLAVEILHYATMENPSNSYDIALLLTGDKDLMPAIIRTRCKGKRVGLVSMRPGCNRALVDTPGLLDFDVIWMEDFLDQLVVPRLFQDGDASTMSEVSTGNEAYSPASLYVLHKVVYDFIHYSGLPRVSSRDLGRYLKQLSVSGSGGITLLDTMKRYYGGMYQYLSSMGYYDCELPSFTQNTTDHSYWISLTESQYNGDEELVTGVEDFRFDKPFSEALLTEAEKQFFSTYSVERLVDDRSTLYMHSMERLFGQDAMPLFDAAPGMTEMFSQSKIPDYNSMTVVELKEICRERGLAVSGTKAVLLSRIHDSKQNDQQMPSLEHHHDHIVAVYLKELILEYLHAKGGVANSRMIGRYLAANKASPKNQGQAANALKELKSLYGNLNSFVATFPDTFISFRDNRINSNSIDGSSSNSPGGNYDFGFSIALKNKRRIEHA